MNRPTHTPAARAKRRRHTPAQLESYAEYLAGADARAHARDDLLEEQDNLCAEARERGVLGGDFE